MKGKVAHRVPLSPRVLDILSLARDFNEADVVFPGRAGEPLSDMALLMAIRRMEGYDTITAHGFRATFKTWAQERTTFDYLVIEAALAHSVKGIERHYLRTTFFEQRQRLMAEWAAFSTGAQTIGKVVRFGS